MTSDHYWEFGTFYSYGLILLIFYLSLHLKMNAAFRKIGSLLIAMVVMLSTMSFSVVQHYCGTQLMDQSLFEELEPCCMDADQAADHTDPCCNEKQYLIEGQNELSRNSVDLELNQQVFFTAFVYSFINVFEGLPEQIVPLRDYIPPLLVTNIQLVDQVFII